MLAYLVYEVSVYGETSGDLTLVAGFANESDARRFVSVHSAANLRLVLGIEEDAPWIERIHGVFTYSD